MNVKKRNSHSGKFRRGVMWLLCVLLVAVLAVLGIFIVYMEKYAEDWNEPTDNHQQQSGETASTQLQDQSGETTSTHPQNQTTEATIQIQISEDVTIPLERGLKITDIGSYTGIFFEDGSDAVVSGVLMILVTNESDRTLQYAQITLTNDQGEKAEFALTTLPAGASAVVLEKNRTAYENGYGNPSLHNVAFFQEEPSLRPDKLKIQASGGALNITNISDADITDEIQIFYKNSASDVFYGGITYMVRIRGGLKAGELRQVVPSHFNASSSTVMFVVMP